jgi:hypothetical protein
VRDMRCLLAVYYDRADHCIGVYLMLVLLATLILYTRLGVGIELNMGSQSHLDTGPLPHGK